MRKKTMFSLIVILALMVNVTTVFAANPDGASGPWADFVADVDQGTRKDGSAVLPERSVPEDALGAADSPQPTINFFSLGFGGSITLGFENYICNDLSVDIKPYEITWGTYPTEKADVSVSQDNITWYDVGTVDNKGNTTVSLPPALYWVQYIKLVDATDPAPLGSDADGYDLDAVQALHSSATLEGCKAEDQGPITTNVVPSPNTVMIGGLVNLTAFVDDSNTGGSSIKSAEYSLEGGAWTGMTASDGGFDEVSEDVQASFTAPSAPGIYDLCVRGTDFYDNTGADECVMLVVYDPSGGFVTGGGWIDSPAGAVAPIENIAYFNGFEAEIEGWFTPTRVMSGNNGIPSASGGYHAESTAGNFTRWGGYNSIFPAGGFVTSIDIYLNMDAGYANDTRFDWSSAVNAADGEHRRDFIFTGGFYNDATGPGAGLNRFVFSASNNSPGWPKNPDRDPFAVTTTGWYTLQHYFYDSGAGVLAVDMSILDAAGNILHTWTLSDPSDVIGTTVGGNRYGWMVTNGFPFLAIDNSVRKEFSDITGKATFGFVSKYKKGASVPDGNTEFQFKAGDLNFHSSSYDWLVVTGSNYAKFKGTGTINGQGSYKFQIWAGDGNPDTFRIKIWWEETDGTEHVVYDNGLDQPIGGGSIVVHTK